MPPVFMNDSILKGEGTSPGIVIGEVFQLPDPKRAPRHRIPSKQIAAELKKLEKAFQKSKIDWQKTLERLSHFNAREQYQILESYLHILQDPHFQKMAKNYIEEHRLNAEWAVERTAEHFQEILKQKEEIGAVCQKLLSHFGEKDPLEALSYQETKNKILVTDSLSPAGVVHVHKHRFSGFVTRSGGKTSHALILARSLKIPALCGVEEALHQLPDGKKIILNGFENSLILNPTRNQLRQYEELADKHALLEKLLLKEAQQPTWTLDKKQIHFEANIELPEEASSALKYGAEGIGLFRSEALFWDPSNPPSETEQLKYYETMIEKMEGHPITIRTMDVSGEEWLQKETRDASLGLRGIRFSLKETFLLKTQLRAILRAGSRGPVKILLPMITVCEEVTGVKELLQEIQTELKREKKPFSKNVPLGVMLEVPASCFIMETLAEEIDFFALGTNDLMQYLFAVDRNNEEVANLYSPFHPALLKILAQTAREADKYQKPILVCGELAGDPLFLPFLIGLGFRHFSMTPLSIPKAKKIARRLDTKKIARWAKKSLKLKGTQEIERELKTLALELDRGKGED